MHVESTPLSTALDQLTKRDTSRTARVFAVRTVLDDTAYSLADALAVYARERSRYHFEPPQRVKRDIQAFCAAASEQCIDIDAAAILSAVVPDSEATVRERASAIRASGLSPRDRRSRVVTLLDNARAHGFAVTVQDLDTDDGDAEGESTTGAVAVSDTTPSASAETAPARAVQDETAEAKKAHGAQVDEASTGESVPSDPETLCRLLWTAEQNYWDARRRGRQC